MSLLENDNIYHIIIKKYDEVHCFGLRMYKQTLLKEGRESYIRVLLSFWNQLVVNEDRKNVVPNKIWS